MKRSVFFQPTDGWVGDLIPFEKDGEFWLFYLHEDRSDPKPGTSWNLVTTKDLTRFEDHGVSLHHGSEADAGLQRVHRQRRRATTPASTTCSTPARTPGTSAPTVRPLQLVMHATSTDGMQTLGQASGTHVRGPGRLRVRRLAGSLRVPGREQGPVADAAGRTPRRRAGTASRRHRPVRLHVI